LHLKIFVSSAIDVTFLGIRLCSNQLESATKTSEQEGERSWRLAIRGRFRENGYECFKKKPFQNLSRNLSPLRRFLPPDDSAAFNGTAASSDALTSTTPHPALRGVVRCSQVPRWGQTK
jgi:hypothetical protein